MGVIDIYTLVMRDDVCEATVRGFQKISEAVEYAENSGAIEFKVIFNDWRKEDEQSREKSASESEQSI